MSSDTLHTQATNFMDFIKTGVDARTGQFTLAFQLPVIPANNLAGPTLSPTLSFSVLGSTRNRGFGFGWSLDLSEINLHQDAPSLRLSSGESFAIDIDNSDISPGNELRLYDAKLKSMVVTCQSDTVFRIDHKSGQTEFLTQQQDSARYLVSEIRSPEGRRLFVEWSAFANEDFMLDSIRDESSTLLQVESDEGEVRFVVPADQARTIRLQMANDALSDVYLPGIETPFNVIYDHHGLNESTHLLLPTSLTSPLGASDAVTWGTGEYSHQLPEGAPFPTLPRVVEWKHSAGPSNTELTRSYEWSGVHNFLGYGSDQAFDWQQGRDNLYEVEQDYDYEVVETQTDPEGKTLSTITRTWNRFHLLTSEVVKRGECEVHTQTTFGIQADTSWTDQPAWCQLPHVQTVTYTDERGAQRSATTEYRYDESGNLVFTRSPAGIEEHSEYYPAEGAEGCPANALGMIRYLKKKTVKPAPLEDGGHGGASEVSTAYTYTSLNSLIEGEPALVLVESEHTRDETLARLMETTVQTYVSEGDGYARLKRTVTTLNDKATTTHYRYELTGDELSTHVSITGFEETETVRQSQDSARSLTTGQMTRDRSLAGVLSRYEYDELGRVTLAVTADDSRYKATRTTTYHVGDKVALAARTGDEKPVMIEHTHATGQRRRQWLDGEGRTVRAELEDLDHAPGEFREIVRTVFDVEGRVISETQTDWLRDENDPASVSALSLTTATEYDDWGQIRCVTTPDGVQTHTEHNPAKLTVKQWQANGDTKGPSNVSLFNAAGSVIQEQLYDTGDTLIRTTRWARDGLDRVFETRVQIEGENDRVTLQRLDFYGRLLEQTLPDGTVVNWTYAQHSDDNHPESVAVTAPEA
ncbi:RHS repeat domain-containing protein [Pseudomonas sp. NPDC088368]|uniref:RHS repeat domain-containing protein n=1 Tax=Pseudomonas sp. NPDC088368 TaxID=3364453 RepID=UPI0038290B42